MSIFKEVFDLIRQERVVLVIGAGFSFKAGMPTCKQLCEAIRNNLPTGIWNEDDGSNEYNKLTSLQDVAQLFIEDWGDNGRDKLIASIKSLFSKKEECDLSDHIALRSIPHFSKLHTTNYDTLIEDTYGEDCYVVKTESDYYDLPKDKVLIFKPHGDFDNPDLMILTRSDYDEWFAGNRSELLWQELQKDISTSSVLFIGYSFSDTNFKKLFKLVQTKMKGKSHRHFLISPGWTRTQINRLSQYNITYYDAKADQFFAELIPYLEKNINKDCARKRTRPETCQKFNLYHHNNAEITLRQNEDNLIKVKALNGAKEKVTFTVCKEKAQLLNDSILPDRFVSPYSGIEMPALVLDAQNGDFDRFSHSLNNIELTTSEIRKIYIQPVSRKGNCVIEIKELKFKEKFEYVFYAIPQKALVHVIKTDLYELKLETTLNEATNIFTTNFTFDFKYNFDSISHARQTAKILLAFQKGMKITINGLAAPDKIELPKRPSEDPRNWSVSQLDIYLRLLEILDDCDISLSHYPVFNPDNLEAAYYLVAYYKHITVPFVIHKPVYLNFAFDDNENVDKPEIAVGKGYYAFIEESCDNRINFGNATITIPYSIIAKTKSAILQNEKYNF